MGITMEAKIMLNINEYGGGIVSLEGTEPALKSGVVLLLRRLAEMEGVKTLELIEELAEAITLANDFLGNAEGHYNFENEEENKDFNFDIDGLTDYIDDYMRGKANKRRGGLF